MTTTPPAPALTMEILNEVGAYRHLTFRRRHDAWDLITTPDTITVLAGGYAHVFSSGNPSCPDLADTVAWTGTDPFRWASRTIAGQVYDWNEDAFRAWLAEEAGIEGVADDAALQILDNSMADLDSEVGARQALAASGLDLTLTHGQAQELYTWDFQYLRALRSMAIGLGHYREHAPAAA